MITTTPTISKPTVIGMTSNGLLIVSHVKGPYLLHPGWVAVSGSVAR